MVKIIDKNAQRITRLTERFEYDFDSLYFYNALLSEYNFPEQEVTLQLLEHKHADLAAVQKNESMLVNQYRKRMYDANNPQNKVEIIRHEQMRTLQQMIIKKKKLKKIKLAFMQL